MDIVERLRDTTGIHEDLIYEAADEIERLRDCEAYNAKSVLWANSQIERLRDALREIYEVYANSEGIPQPMTAAEGYLLFLLKETAKIAQETLQEKE